MTTIELLAAVWAAATALGLGLLIRRARYSAAPSPLLQPGVGQTSSSGSSPNEAALLLGESRELDVEHEFSAVIGALHELAAANIVELQTVLQPGIKIWSDLDALREVLIQTLTDAIHRAAGGGVLLSAHWDGGCIQTTITDDAAPGDPMRLRASLQRVEECISLQGGTLEISCSALHGNVLTFRLPGVGEPPRAASDDAPTEEPQVREISRHRVVRSAP